MYICSILSGVMLQQSQSVLCGVTFQLIIELQDIVVPLFLLRNKFLLARCCNFIMFCWPMVRIKCTWLERILVVLLDTYFNIFPVVGEPKLCYISYVSVICQHGIISVLCNESLTRYEK